MSSKTDRLNKLIDEQQAILNSLKSEASSIASDDVLKENEQLKNKINELSKARENLKNENDALQKSLDDTKSALFAKAANEKLAAFTSVQSRIERDYYRKGNSLDSRLDDYKNNCIKSIDETIRVIENYGSAQFDDIINQLNLLKKDALIRRDELENYKSAEFSKAEQYNFAIGENLKNEPLTEVEKKTASKQKSLESFIGLNIPGKAGILLFIIGIIMLGRFAYVHMSDVFKGGLIYLLGIVLLVVGELFYKKEKTVFSTTLLSGGVATLYAAAATCFFAFELYSSKLTFVICVLITAVAVAISNQVKSQAVCAFGAVGGYLPVVAIYMMGFGKAAADITFLPVSSVYFCLFAVIIFAMTYNKKWYVAQFIGYALHLFAVGGVAKCAYSLHKLSGYGYALPLAAAFAIASFVIYLMMPSVKIVKRKPLLLQDNVLLALNTVSGAISVSITVRNIALNRANPDRITGLVFFVFTAIYIVLSAFSVKDKKKENGASVAITSIGALAFSMLVVPYLFGVEYIGIGWAAEGAILALVGIQKRIGEIEFTGLLCLVLSAVARCAFGGRMSTQLAVVTSAVIVGAFWIYTLRGLVENSSNKGYSAVYVATELVSAYSSVWLVKYVYDCIVSGAAVSATSEFTGLAVVIIAMIVFSVVIRHGILRNNVSLAVGDFLSVIVFAVALFALDISQRYSNIETYFGDVAPSKAFIAVNIVLLIVVNICTALFISAAALDVINRYGAPAWLFTMTVSLSALVLITVVATVQFGVKFSNGIISALYIAVSCIMLFVGFKRRYTVVRSGGLVLVLCAFAKLCFVDTFHLDSAWKIASYFAFGAILIAISYFYQRFSKKIESETVEIEELDS